jgi:hypothetical protein
VDGHCACTCGRVGGGPCMKGECVETGVVVAGHGFLGCFVRISLVIVGYISTITGGDKP